jgi:2,4-dienoyl-CoA reductase-like NADH-dependent reductase (Old Yellow Enzyme family)
MLFEPFASPALKLKNRVVMAPLTRSRAVDHNTPNGLMAEYYAQRAGAGLIITEGTSPSPNISSPLSRTMRRRARASASSGVLAVPRSTTRERDWA